MQGSTAWIFNELSVIRCYQTAVIRLHCFLCPGNPVSSLLYPAGLFGSNGLLYSGSRMMCGTQISEGSRMEDTLWAHVMFCTFQDSAHDMRLALNMQLALVASHWTPEICYSQLQVTIVAVQNIRDAYVHVISRITKQLQENPDYSWTQKGNNAALKWLHENETGLCCLTFWSMYIWTKYLVKLIQFQNYSISIFDRCHECEEPHRMNRPNAWLRVRERLEKRPSIQVVCEIPPRIASFRAALNMADFVTQNVSRISRSTIYDRSC